MMEVASSIRNVDYLLPNYTTSHPINSRRETPALNKYDIGKLPIYVSIGNQ
jgi:hypothetical protein